jgi:hypothetical protein
MPRIYGNLQRQQRDWRPLLRGFMRVVWSLAILGVIYLFFFGPLFRVKSVEIQGTALSDPAYIKDSVPLGVSMWNIPSDDITKRIVEHEPVDQVEVLRGLPSSVRVVVHEHQPEVAWIAKGKLSLLDAYGDVFLQYDADKLPANDTPIGAKIATLPHIVDTQNIDVPLDAQIVSADLVRFSKDTFDNLHRYLPDYVWERAEIDASLYDMTFISTSGLRVAMNVLGDSGIQVRNLTRLVQQGKAHPNSIIDLRIDRWAYVHEP